jgi:hypothetical protein
MVHAKHVAATHNQGREMNPEKPPVAATAAFRLAVFPPKIKAEVLGLLTDTRGALDRGDEQLIWDPKAFTHVASIYTLAINQISNDVGNETCDTAGGGATSIMSELVFVGVSLASQICVSGGNLVSNMEGRARLGTDAADTSAYPAASRAYFKLSEILRREVKVNSQWHQTTAQRRSQSTLTTAADKDLQQLAVPSAPPAPLVLDGCVAVDLGASPGGWTQCLGHNGCAVVYAIDPGAISPEVLAEARGETSTGGFASGSCTPREEACEGMCAAMMYRLVHVRMTAQHGLPAIIRMQAGQRKQAIGVGESEDACGSAATPNKSGPSTCATGSSRFVDVWVCDMNTVGLGDNLDMLLKFHHILHFGALVVITLKNFNERRGEWERKQNDQALRMKQICDSVKLTHLIANGRDESTLSGYYRGGIAS